MIALADIDIRQRALTNHQISKAIEQYGTPLYLYDFDIIHRQVSTLRQYLPDNVHVHYALKANANLAICHHLARLCGKADVCSMGELQTALKAGFPPDQIVYTGTSKDEAELSMALDAGCGLIVLESEAEIHRLQNIAQRKGIVQDVLIRINPLYRTDNSCDIQFADKEKTSLKTLICNHAASKFGIDEEDIERVLGLILKMDNLHLKGIHIFTESNVLNYLEMLASWENTITIANRLRAKGYPITTIDFGGGIGIPYNTIDAPFDMAAFGQHLQSVIDSNPYQYKFIAELGRYPVADSGAYITTVLDIKQSQGKTFIVINGGRHQLYRPAFIADMNKNMEVLGKENSPKMKAKIVGRLPTSSDVMIEEMMIAEDISIGDQIVIYTCGAYGFGLSMTNFLLHNYPAEAAYKNGNLSIIRHRGKVEDFFLNQPMI